MTLVSGTAEYIFESHMDGIIMENGGGDWNWVPFSFIDKKGLGQQFADYMADIRKDHEADLDLEEDD